ncbi:MAG TPA: hypothetical protein VK613_04910 [Gaiellaceae bacterium]|nr:hypothetical protein [Gaiellaceae bacterium]
MRGRSAAIARAVPFAGGPRAPRGRVADAEPPYPGKADYYDERQEVDHAWRRQVRPTRSRRPLNAWEPLIVYGGREMPTDRRPGARRS